jgi:hypothetical protein
LCNAERWSAADTGIPRSARARQILDLLERVDGKMLARHLSVSRAQIERGKAEVLCVGCCSRIDATIETLACEPCEEDFGPRDPIPQRSLRRFLQVASTSQGLVILFGERLLDNKEVLSSLLDHFSTEEFEDLWEEEEPSVRRRKGRNGRTAVRRCLAHSQKSVPLPVLLDSWPLFLARTTEAELEDLMCIAEREMAQSLEAYTKRRKLCVTCRKRVLAVFHDLQKKQVIVIDDDGEAFSDESEHDDESPCLTEESLLAAEVRYCVERHEVVIPLGQVECLTEVLRRADEAHLRTSSHATTPGAAREEFLACLSLILKDRLDTLWRIKKSEEMVNAAICRLVAKTVLKQLQAAGGACDAEDLASLFDEKKTKKKKKRNKTKKADSEGVKDAEAHSDSDEADEKTVQPGSPGRAELASAGLTAAFAPTPRSLYRANALREAKAAVPLEDNLVSPRTESPTPSTAVSTSAVITPPKSPHQHLEAGSKLNHGDELALLHHMGWTAEDDGLDEVDADKENDAACGLTDEEIAAFRAQANLQKVRESRAARIADFERWQTDYARVKPVRNPSYAQGQRSWIQS